MSPRSNSVETSHTELFSTILDNESGELFVIRPDEDVVEALVEILGRVDNPLEVRLLAEESVLKGVRRPFVTASAAADLIEAETLSLRTSDEDFPNSLVLTEETVVSVVSEGKHLTGLVTDDAEFIKSARERWTMAWESAEEFGLRTPGRSRVENSLSEEFGSEASADFRTMLDVLETARSEHGVSRDGLTEVGVSLLMAAKHGELLYEISK